MKGPTLAAFALLLVFSDICNGAYYGKLIGKLSELHHGLSGEVYAVDARTLYIKDFTYDGEGPAAYFYAGSTKSPGIGGFRVRDERGTTEVLKRYRKKDITLTLPEGKTLDNIKWFSVWCDEFSVNFGDVRIPRGFDYPRPRKLAELNGVHGVSSEPVVLVDAQTLLIPGFSYDGEAPDAKFWTGSGPRPSPQGIRVPDENGKEQPLRRYDRKTIVLTLPGDLTVHQLGHFGVWCEAFAVDFGHVEIPQGLNVPPSLKMLGVSPQSKLNCEVLEDNLAFEVRWAVAGDSIVVQLVGKLETNEYMAFGLSPDPEKSVMIGSDVAVAWVDKRTLQGYAVDYFLDAKSQCSGTRGSCPDTRIQENTNSVRLLNAAMVNGYSIVTYQRPLKASDRLDLPIRTNGSQAIVWAIGPLNERGEVSFHTSYLKSDRLIEFGRPPSWNCPMPDQDRPDEGEKPARVQRLVVTTRRPKRLQATPAPAPKNDAWEIPPIQCYEPEDGVFYAQMGPTGGKHGYPAITGHVGWGISWYINGLLIPEIHVVRGRKYTFVVEGGQDSEIPARYHPFYVTDDPVGGFLHKTPEEKAAVKVFAGVRRQRGNVIPTGAGRFCNWMPDQSQPLADEFASFGAYQRTLTLECEPGEPGIVEWTPDNDTPDTVYYQCFTHRYLGWKIHVHDDCQAPSAAASEVRETYVLAPNSDLEGSFSIRVPSKVTADPEFPRHRQEYAMHRPPPRYTNLGQGPPKLGYHPPLTRSNQPFSYDRGQFLPPVNEEHDRKSHRLDQEPKYHRHPLHRHYDGPFRSHRGPSASASQPVYSYKVTDTNSREPNPNHSKLLPDHHRAIMSQLGKYSLQTQKTIPRRPYVQKRRPVIVAKLADGTGNQGLALGPEWKKPIFGTRPPWMSGPQGQPEVSRLWAKMDRDENQLENASSGEGKPPFARNTGFDPKSVVIEGGFEPIIGGEVRESMQERSSNASIETEKTVDSFEPVFVPSPPDRVVGRKRPVKKVQSSRGKTRLDELDDMETAADRLDSRYLPPGDSSADELPAGTFVTYDGKRVRDPGLARSASSNPKISGQIATSRFPLSSTTADLLTGTPRFGKFMGELPPPVPGDVQPGQNPQLSLKDSQRRRLPAFPLQRNTKLRLLSRSERSAGDAYERTEFSGSDNSSLPRDHGLHLEEPNHRPRDMDSIKSHDFVRGDQDRDSSSIAGAGQILLANLEYVVLTAILYFAI
ncbi:protein Skeletor, isoforms B/C [Orussus abietinus]|uniref:protein Skeletor, isoforms B/C n=1 Tax=Orussus abietinus TaxID=222816 RepID=UPI000C715E48|nr:protein Skeletor, isoforms B/C [Orussus abietinus]